ncbi:IucA/IucC family C-terminal-domain containing protein [Fictibacillus iocasae]|uniref:IucA/IucC family C-terminal-domain containing protein n=1 Tax=Fictibacillus iocasae TaxID=2715437 RepID=A0ABW2NUI7_9BACL
MAFLNVPSAKGWTKDEQDFISSHYRFSFRPSSEEHVIPAEDLLDGKRLLAFLDDIGPKIGSQHRKVSASLFFKRYAFCSLTAALYAMTMLNKSFNTSISNVQLVDHEAKEMWLPSFTLTNADCIALDRNREDWRSFVLEMIFKENIAVMLNHVASTAKVSKAMLWENCWIYIRWLYEKWLSEEHPAAIKQQIISDYQFISLNSPPSLFGTRKHPFMRLRTAGDLNGNKIRQTCCLYYRTEGGTCCKTCPNK